MTNIVKNKNGIEFDIDAIATDLNGKMDKDGNNATASVCIESWHKGTEWYRVYSDGWCEQGGYVKQVIYAGTNILFKKKFVGTNYNLNANIIFDSSDTGSVSIGNKSTTGATLRIYGHVISSGAVNSSVKLPCMWEAKGYIR